LKAEMFYIDEEVRDRMTDVQSKVIRFVGLTFHDQQERYNRITQYNLRSTEYSNEFELDLQINRTVVLEGIKFESPVKYE